MKRIIGYVNTADLNHMREEDVRALTVINIAFGLIRDGEVVWDAKDARDGIVSIRKSNPELKIVLSVGGWGADGFSQAARTKEGRERFAASALAIVKEYVPRDTDKTVVCLRVSGQPVQYGHGFLAVSR